MTEAAAEVRPPEEPLLPDEDEREQEENDEAGEAALDALVPWRPSLLESARDAWHGRRLLPALSLRVVPTYDGYFFGRAWIVLRPALPIIGFAVLGGAIGAATPNGVPYLLFLVFSMQGWYTFQQAVLFQCRGARMFQKLAKKLKLPLLLIPFASLSLSLIYLAVYWFLGGVILLYYLFAEGHLYLAPLAQLPVGILGLALALAWGWAAGIPFSLLYLKARDVRLGLRYFTQLWMFMTPVLYSLDSLHGTARTLAQFNPLTGTMSLVQYGFLDVGTPRLYPVAWSLGSLLVLATVGLWLFNRHAVPFLGLDPGSRSLDDEEGEGF